MSHSKQSPVASKKTAMAKKMSDKPNMQVILHGKQKEEHHFKGRSKSSDRKEMESTYQHMQGY